MIWHAVGQSYTMPVQVCL